jgi:hypothetical protein
MRNFNGQIRKADIENRRNFLWANLIAFGVVAVMAVFLLMSNGGAPRSDVTQAQPATGSSSLRNG